MNEDFIPFSHEVETDEGGFICLIEGYAAVQYNSPDYLDELEWRVKGYFFDASGNLKVEARGDYKKFVEIFSDLIEEEIEENLISQLIDEGCKYQPHERPLMAELI